MKDECHSSVKIITKRMCRLSLKTKAKKQKRKSKYSKRKAYEKTPYNTNSFLIRNYQKNLIQYEPEDEFPIGTMREPYDPGVFLEDTHPLEDGTAITKN